MEVTKHDGGPAQRVRRKARLIGALLLVACLGGASLANLTPLRAHASASVSIKPKNAASPSGFAGTQLVAFGENDHGETGNGTFTTSTPSASLTPGYVQGLPVGDPITQMAAGYYHSVALTASGKVLTWGYNNYGQLGNNTTTNSATAITVTGFAAGDPIVAVAAGYYHSLALTASGKVWAWGRGDYGQLGNGTTSQSNVPVPVTGLPGGDAIVAIAGNNLSSIALGASGQVYDWGYNGNYQLGNGTSSNSAAPVAVQGLPFSDPVVAISSENQHVLALTRSGVVWSWGYNGYGQLGNNTTSSSASAVSVQGLPISDPIVSIAAGGNHSLAVTTSGQVYAWGLNNYGQLGNTTTNNYALPVQVNNLPGLANDPAIVVGAGDQQSLVETASGKVYTFGFDNLGQLGNGTILANTNARPVQLRGLPSGQAISVVGGGQFSLVLVGASTSSAGATATAAAATSTAQANATATAVAAVGGNSGTVWMAGQNNYGQLGNGQFSNAAQNGTSILSPVTGLPTNDPIVQIADGTQTDFAVTASGKVYSWGYNSNGQLGNGTCCTNTATAGQVIGLAANDPVVQVYQNNSTAIALTRGGAVWAWGANGYGQLGTGNATQSSVPVPVVGLPVGDPVVQVGADGNGASFALTRSGLVYGWGAGPYGDLGNGTGSGYGPTPTGWYGVDYQPELVYGLPSGDPVMQIATGDETNMAVTASGKVYAWGYDYYGEVGNCSQVGYTQGASYAYQQGVNQAYQVTGLPSGDPVVGAAAGYASFAVLASGKVYAWGYNGNGALANGSASSYTCAPGQVQGLPGSDPVVQVTAGSQMGAALTRGGAIYAWGLNGPGSLGIGNFNSPQTTAQPVIAPSGTLRPVSIAMSASNNTNLMVLYGTQSNAAAATATAAAATAAISTTVARTATAQAGLPSGTLYAWGDNYYGGLGNGTYNQNTPNGDTVPGSVTGLPANDAVVQVSGGYRHTVALTASGKVLAWGYNNYGQLGNGTTTNSAVPITVTGLPTSDPVVQVYAATYWSEALTASGAVYAWGYNAYGQLGNGTTTNSAIPLLVNGLPGGDKVVAISGEEYTGLAVTQGGAVYAWGYNGNYELGNASNTTNSSTPTRVIGLPSSDPVVAIAGTSDTGFAATASGKLYAWGYGAYGQLGNGGTSSVSAAVSVIGLPGGDPIVTVSGGTDNSVAAALTASGKVYAWGYNGEGELGNGTTTNSSTPIQVTGLPTGDPIARIAQSATGLALGSSGKLYAWGYNAYGQLGNGTTSNSTTPITVTGLPSFTGVKVVSISAGTWHNAVIYGSANNSAAATATAAAGTNATATAVARATATAVGGTNGSAWAWGENDYGAIGIGNTTSSNPSSIESPAQVIGLSATDPVVSEVGGINHTLALTAGGKIYAWGRNDHGQLGNGSTTNSNTPVAVIGLPTTDPVVQISAGWYFSMALTQSGAVYAWGEGDYANISPSANLNNPTPVLVVGLPVGDPVVQVSAGDAFATALTASGKVYAWGFDYYGGLGNGLTEPNSSAIAQSLSAPYQVLGLPTADPIKSISASTTDNFVLALTTSGKVYSWGYNGYGELGNNTTTNTSTAVAVLGLPGSDPVTVISAGENHSAAVTASGKVYAWGLNSSGQLGNASTTNSSQPVLTTGLPISDTVIGVSAGQAHTLAVTASGKVYAWGANGYGQLGLGNQSNYSTPQLVPGLPSGPLKPVAVYAGYTNSYVVVGVTSNAAATAAAATVAANATATSVARTATAQAGNISGAVWTWGRNIEGELGNGSTSPSAPNGSSLPGQVSGLPTNDPVVSVGSAYLTTYAATASGLVYAWGQNSNNELGNGTTTNSSLPGLVQGLPTGDPVVAVTTGNSDNKGFALTASGKVYSWGQAANGRSGNGSTTNNTIAAQVTGLPAGDPVVKVASGGNFALAVTASGRVYAWGYNGYGQLGDGSTVDRYSAVQVQNLPSGDPAIAVAAQNNTSMVLTASGKVYGWGYNYYGEMGNGTTSGGSANTTPTLVVGLPSNDPAQAISAGGDTGYALTRSGLVYSWGYNNYGQIGNGGTGNSAVAVQVGGLPTGDAVTSISAGYQNGLAITTSGKVYTWGRNDYGQLGIGNYLSNTTYISQGTTYSTDYASQVVGLPTVAGARPVAIVGGGYHTILIFRASPAQQTAVAATSTAAVTATVAAATANALVTVAAATSAAQTVVAATAAPQTAAAQTSAAGTAAITQQTAAAATAATGQTAIAAAQTSYAGTSIAQASANQTAVAAAATSAVQTVGAAQTSAAQTSAAQTVAAAPTATATRTAVPTATGTAVPATSTTAPTATAGTALRVSSNAVVAAATETAVPTLGSTAVAPTATAQAAGSSRTTVQVVRSTIAGHRAALKKAVHTKAKARSATKTRARTKPHTRKPAARPRVKPHTSLRKPHTMASERRASRVVVKA